MNSYFLLNSKTAENLYKHVKNLPIIDYHNHLSLTDISENKRFFDVYDLWIKPDPYKHRAMRMCGFPEKYITGDATNEEKFVKWCEAIPNLIGNPLYHWSVMELETIFNISELPNGRNGERIYHLCNKYLKENIVSADTLFKKFNVEYACPCASLIDDITVFENSKSFSPSLRGDDIVNLSPDFIKKLENASKMKIDGLEALENAIKIRLDRFELSGCRFSDHALDNAYRFYKDDGKNYERFKLLLSGTLNKEDKDKLSSYMLVFLGREYARRGFVMQLHIGAERYTSTKLRNTVGPAGGFAGIGNSVDVISLTAFLDTLDCTKYGLPKTILFTLNPADNALISVLSGSFSKEGVRGLITQGPAWWWCDNKYAICDMLEISAAFSTLSNFVGMTTDSRSFLSFVRHDYFRRILCDWIGKKFEANELLCSYEDLVTLICKMCYQNVKEIIGGLSLCLTKK